MGPLGLLGRWIDDLTDGALAVADRLSRRRRFRLRPVDGRFAVVAVDGSTERPVGTVELRGSEPLLLPESLAKTVESNDLEIMVPAGAVVVRELEPMPAESRGFVDGVVRHRLDRLVPWRPVDVLYAATVDDKPDGRIGVTVTATSRRVLVGQLTAAAALKPFRLAIVAEGAAQAAPIPVAIGRAQGVRRTNVRRAIAALAAVVALVVLAEAGRTVFALSTDADELATLDQSIADRRVVLKAAADAAARAAGPSEDIAALKQTSPVVAVVIEGLSQTLPDDAYLTDLTLDATKLRIIGVSTRVAELLPMVEAAPDFTGAAFFAPTVRLPDAAGDRFSIEATVVPRTEVGP